MELPVTFGDYYLLEQIKKLNLRRIQISNQLRDAGVEVDAKKKLPGYPDSYIHGKVFSQLMSTMLLYMSEEPFQNMVNPYGGLYEFDKGVGKGAWSNGKLFEKKVVVKTDKKRSGGWQQMIMLLREYFIGTRLNHLRREIPHFMFTYGYTMCQPKTTRKGNLECGQEKILFDGGVNPITVLTKEEDWFSYLWRRDSIDFDKYNDWFRDKCVAGKKGDMTCRLSVWDGTRTTEHTFDKSGKPNKPEFLKFTGVPTVEEDPFENKYPNAPHIFLEHVDAVASLYDWSDAFQEEENVVMVLYSMYFQLVLALSMAQEKFSFLHLDLHGDNILVTRKKEPVTITYTVYGSVFSITTEYVPVIIDYGMSRITHDGVPVYSSTENQDGVYQTGVFLPHLDFLGLSETFRGLFKKHHKRFRPYIEIFPAGGSRGIATASDFIAMVARYPAFNKIVNVRSPLEHPSTPIYWGLSPLFLSGQQLTGDSVTRWCDQLYSSLQRCNQDTGSLILNTIQTRVLNEAAGYLHKIKSRVNEGSSLCKAFQLPGIPITNEQIKADEDGLDLASKIPLQDMAHDFNDRYMPLMRPVSLSENIPMPESWKDSIFWYAYMPNEAAACARTVAKEKDLFDAAEQLVNLVKYIVGMSFGSEELDSYLQGVVKNNKWDVAVLQLCNPLRADDLMKANFLEKFRANKTYLQQFCEGMQIFLNSITTEALITRDQESATLETRVMIGRLKRMFEIVPDMFNPAFIEFIMSQPK